MARIFALVALLVWSSTAFAQGAEESSRCSDVTQQISDAAEYVGPRNFAFQLDRDGEARMILMLQKPSPKESSLRWRLIERQGESINYCTIGQGSSFTMLADMHLSNPSGRYGMPGSGHPRCAGKQESGLPGSLDIRMWANRELGSTIIHALPNERGRDFVFLSSADNTGAWIVLDSNKENLDDTCYYTRGESSELREDIRAN